MDMKKEKQDAIERIAKEKEEKTKQNTKKP
jgi:hypothetical protein